MTKKIPLRGVNLGGWLVLEKWMTPTLFAGTGAVDEYTFMQTDGAKQKLDAHRQTFIQESDFAWLRDNGLTAVRIPVGYWIFAPDEPYVSGLIYLDWAFKMAEKYDLKVLLDLHGAPGSQNGRDHSGKVGEARWFARRKLRLQTISVLKYLHQRYENSSSFWGLQLLNEPKLGIFHLKLRKFYKKAALAINGTQKIVFHDAFTPRLLSGALRHDERSIIDIHFYHMASLLARFMTARQFVRISHWLYTTTLRRVSRKQPAIIGEWSAVIKGEKLQHVSEKEAQQLMYSFGRLQLEVYEKESVGWFYWNYKTEEAGAWNFRSLVDAGILRVPRSDK